MRAGLLRHTVKIEEAHEARDTMGGVIVTWKEYATVYAAIEPLTGREAIQAAQLQAQVDHRIRIRYLPGVVPKMRVTHDERAYDIQAVLDVEGRRRELHLMAKVAA